MKNNHNGTVDGSKIRQTHQLRDRSFIPLFTLGFSTSRWLGMGFLNHQQYELGKYLENISLPPLDPKTMKNECFQPPIYGL